MPGKRPQESGIVSGKQTKGINMFVLDLLPFLENGPKSQDDPGAIIIYSSICF